MRISTNRRRPDGPGPARRTVLPTALLLLFGAVVLAAASRPQEVEVREVQSFRVHLVNGGVLTADAVRETPGSLLLSTRQGQVTIRRTLVDRVERVVERRVVERPAPKPAPRPTAPELRPEALPPAVELLLARLQAAPEERRQALLQDLVEAARPVLPALARRLETADAALRPYLAAALLENREAGAVDAVLPLLDAPDGLVRAEAARILGLLGDLAAYPALARLLGDRQAPVRAAAVEALGLLGSSGAFAAIGPSCADPDRDVRLRALEALPRLAEATGRWADFDTFMTDAFRQTRDEARADVIAALGISGRRGLAGLLEDGLRDRSPAIRAASVNALVNLDAADFAERILDVVRREEHPLVRAALAAAAQRFRLQAAIDPLIGWVEDPDPEVAGAAVRALRGLTGRNFGPDAAAWAAWWRAVRPAR